MEHLKLFKVLAVVLTISWIPSCDNSPHAESIPPKSGLRRSAAIPVEGFAQKTPGPSGVSEKMLRESELNEALARIDEGAGKGLPPDQNDIKKIGEILSKYTDDTIITTLIVLPPYLYPYFEDEIIRVTSLPLSSPNQRNLLFMYSTELLARLHTNKGAASLMAAAEKAPKYKYSPVPIPMWTQGANSRGALGDIYSAMATNGDPTVMNEYCQRLASSTDEDDQRTMLFGMRSSVQYADFDFLLQLRAVTNSELIRKHIDAALNHIAANFKNQSEIAIDNSDYNQDAIKSPDQRLSDLRELQSYAKQANEILDAQKLHNTELFFLY